MSCAAILHTVVILALIASYTTLTALGNDGTPVLGVLAGYLGGVATPQLAPAIERVASKLTGGTGA